MEHKKLSKKLVFVGMIILLLCGLWKWHDYRETKRWRIEVTKPAPVYESKEYPYGTESRSNKIVEYLQLGQEPFILGVFHGYDWIYFEVRLPDSRRGYVFDGDVDARRVR